MSPAAILSIVVRANTAEANAALMRTDALMRSTAASGSAMGARMAAATRALSVGTLAVGVIAGKMAMDFQRNMTLVQTQAGASAGEVRNLSGQILNLARNSQFSPDQLAQGLFRVESHGYRGAQAMRVLNNAQKLAAVGNSDLEQTTYAYAAALNSGIRGTQNMGQAAGTLNAIVGLGSLRMDELVAAMNTGVLPAARNFGITLRQAGAALDVMTRAGMPAQLSATRLRMTFSLLAAPSDRAISSLKMIGITQTELAKDMRKGPDGLITAIVDLHDHLQRVNPVQQAQILSRAFGGGRSSSAIQTLVENVGELRDVYGQINQKANEFPHDYYVTQQTSAYKLHQAWSSIQADLVTLGHDIAPVIAEIATGGAAVLHLFAGLPSHVKTVVFEIGLLAWPILKAAGGVEAIAVNWGLVAERQALAAESATSYTATMGAAVAEEESQAAALQELVVLLNEMNVSAEAFVATMTEASATMAATGELGGGAAMAGVLGRPVMGSAMRGLGIGAAGVIGSQVIGGMVGGEAGHQISRIGTGAAIGAGVGSIIPGVGTLTGAGIGAAAAGITELIHSAKRAETPLHAFNRNIGEAHAAMKAAASAENRWAHANNEFAPTQHHLNHLIDQGKGATREAATAAQHYIDIVTGRQQDAKQFHDEISKLQDKIKGAEANAADLVARYQAVQHLQQRVNQGAQAFATPRAFERAQEHIAAAPSRSDVEQALGNLTALRDSISRDLRRHKIVAPLTVDQGQMINQIHQAAARAGASKRDQAKIHLFLERVPPKDVTAAQHAVNVELAKGRTKPVMKFITDDNGTKVQVSQLMQDVAKITGTGGKKSGKALTDNMNASLRPGMQSLTQFINNSLDTIGGRLNSMAQQAGSTDRITIGNVGGANQANQATKLHGGLLAGLPTGDSIPLLAEGGEYVVNADATREHLPLLEAINAAHPRGYREGGKVIPDSAQGFANDMTKWGNMWYRKHVHGPYTFPFKNISGFTWGRTDMGLDSTGSGPVLAAGDGTVVSTGAPGWPGGGGWVLQLNTTPPNAPGPKSDTMYQFEHMRAAVSSGTKVQSGQVLGHQIDGFPFQETGWAHSGTGQPLASDVYHEGMVTAPGRAMTSWMKALASNKHQKGGPVGMISGGAVARMAAGIGHQLKAPDLAMLALFEAMLAESTMNSDAGGGGLLQAVSAGLPHAPAAQIRGFLTGHHWTQGASTYGGAIAEAAKNLPAYEIAQNIQQSGAGRASHGQANYGAQSGTAQSWLGRVWHTVKGGTTSTSLGHHGHGHNITQQQANELGIPTALYNKVKAVQNNIAASSDLADRSDQLKAPVNGRTELQWLTDELGYLLQLRNMLIKIYTNVYRTQTAHQKQLTKINQEIKSMERNKPTAPKHQPVPTGKKATNAEKKAVKNANDQAEANYHKQTVQYENRLKALKKRQSELRSSTHGTGTTGATGTTQAIKDLLDQTQGTTFGTDDPLGMKVLATLPPVGVLGGDIFKVQMQIQDLNGNATAATDNSASSARADALQAQLTATQQMLYVANMQAPILQQLPQLISGTSGNPFLGGFATGGMIPGSGTALVGENGPELIDFKGQGARITPASGTSGGEGQNHVHVTLEDNRTAVHVNDELVREIFHEELNEQVSIARRRRSGQ